MSSRFMWQEVKTEYREVRPSKHGEELRWIVNRETIVDTATSESVTRGTIRHPGICVMVPFLDDERIILMHQYRYAADESSWELPAGTLAGRQDGWRVVSSETPEECAARELLEETGYRAGELEKVCECYVMPGSSDELLHLFFARRLVRGEQALDVGEIIHEVRPFDMTMLDEMIDQRQIRDAKTLIGIFHAMRRRRHPVRPAHDG